MRRLVSAILLLFALPLVAQRPAHYDSKDADFTNGLELFSKAKYGAAQYEFQHVIERIGDRFANTRVEAEYYSALCAVRLFNDDAGYRLLTFMDEHPEDLHVPAIRFELFKYMFAQKKWDDAIAWSDKVDRLVLSVEETEEYRFKRGYSYFQMGDEEKALGEFSQVTTTEGTYGTPSLYYTSHIQYDKGNYETALIGFRKLENDENFSKLVPFYIAEILFLQGKYEELSTYSKPILESPDPGTRRVGDINRLAGEANYRTGNYEAALPYLQKSIQRVGVDRNDRYILAYTYYKTGDYQKALGDFNIVANGEDSLAQLAVYHMADCYLKLNNKNY
ncbi:MAG TPA: CDC27 family protein, partial [Flavobacteriales bacterium]|nr:CDC27 family protein [Flavobacteriales bacterium]